MIAFQCLKSGDGKIWSSVKWLLIAFLRISLKGGRNFYEWYSTIRICWLVAFRAFLTVWPNGNRFKQLKNKHSKLSCEEQVCSTSVIRYWPLERFLVPDFDAGFWLRWPRQYCIWVCVVPRKITEWALDWLGFELDKIKDEVL